MEAGCSPVIVIVGDKREQIATELASLPVEIVANMGWREGIGSSIRAGVHCINETDADGAILLACDQPRLEASFLRELQRVHATGGRQIAASAYAGTLGIPALFGRVYFAALLTLEGDRGAKALILSHPSDVVAVPFPGGELDIDTPADLDRLA